MQEKNARIVEQNVLGANQPATLRMRGEYINDQFQTVGSPYQLRLGMQ
jgi:hypothetical protein